MDYNGGHMEAEKTLLQQIRDKEQEFSKKLESVKQETDAQIATEKARRDKALLEAERNGKIAAEELLRKEQQKTDNEIERMKNAAAAETNAARVKGEKNLPLATDKIVSYVIME
jgi:vacuolar-type H+-ATPase subunit H